MKPTARYQDYRELLRWDFWFSCAYCAITEIEACGIGFQIDHYEPQSVRRELIAEYSNLLWACSLCNRHKGSVCPSQEERAAGLRYFRPDLDDAYEHFEVAGVRLLNGLTKVGTFTIEMLFLNRLALQEIRELRRELFEANQEILIGIRALQDISIDQLNPAVRTRFTQIRRRLEQRASVVTSGDDLVREFNRSVQLDRDPDQLELTRGRREWLAAEKALLPRIR